MPVKAVVFAILMVIMICIAVSLVEMVIPLSARAEMNTQCRRTLLNMEVQGGLTSDEKTSLEKILNEVGFSSISISGTETAKFGDEMFLKVEAKYCYSRLMGLFSRNETEQKMMYERISVSRKVVN